MQRKEGMAILISNKIDFRAKKITKTREGHYTVTERLIHQEDKAILNAYPENRTAKRVKQKLKESKGELTNPQFYLETPYPSLNH